MDSKGNLYGTRANGGSKNFGAVYELTPSGKSWKYTELYSFTNTDPAGAQPYGGLIMDADGNLYGTASSGGGDSFAGAVFELTKKGTKWTAKPLYQFCPKDGCKDGSAPYAGLTYAGASTGVAYDGTSPLYGVTYHGPSQSCTSLGCGVAFSLTLTGKKWTEEVLYTFCQKSGCDDGAYPGGPLMMDASGNLFGITTGGGAAECGDDTRCGTMFELSHKKGERKKSAWTETVLHSFCTKSNCADGQAPNGNLLMDATGNFYGTTFWGGSKNYGTIFKMTYDSKFKSWTENIAYNFCSASNCADGSLPEAGLTMDSKGNLFGTTASGGHGTYNGTVFELGKTYSVLYEFCSKSDCTDGERPETSVVLDKSGNLFGGTTNGGSEGGGTVFEVLSGK
jgi:uncharacterized repeat protein (TIGR03803 family)